VSQKIKILVVCLFASVISLNVFASKPFQASLVPGIAIYDRNQEIEGVTLSFWGENPQTSLALGIVNGTSGDSAGVSFGFLNYGDSYKGVQFGTANVDKSLYGAQFGLVNYSQTTKTGLQFGFINVISDNKKWFSNFPYEIAPVMLFINWRLEK
jgi:hypothetical protein